MEEKEALKLLENGDINSCIDYFKTNNHSLEYGYCLLLTGHLIEAEKIFSSIDSVRADWLLKIIQILKGYLKEYPTYFQIRNFLEIDLTMFFKTKQLNYIRQIVSYADIFQNINGESYKFLARAFLKNDYPNVCKPFLDKSLSYFYNDVELHYLFAEYYLYMNDYKHAKVAVENCLRINPDYFPAKKTKTILELSSQQN